MWKYSYKNGTKTPYYGYTVSFCLLLASYQTTAWLCNMYVFEWCFYCLICLVSLVGRFSWFQWWPSVWVRHTWRGHGTQLWSCRSQGDAICDQRDGKGASMECVSCHRVEKKGQRKVLKDKNIIRQLLNNYLSVLYIPGTILGLYACYR